MYRTEIADVQFCDGCGAKVPTTELVVLDDDFHICAECYTGEADVSWIPQDEDYYAEYDEFVEDAYLDEYYDSLWDQGDSWYDSDDEYPLW